tara:strand:+ start:575 stop:748 length:174 start_codon:yes stop_codon:yes gene_type:complete
VKKMNNLPETLDHIDSQDSLLIERHDDYHLEEFIDETLDAINSEILDNKLWLNEKYI